MEALQEKKKKYVYFRAIPKQNDGLYTLSLLSGFDGYLLVRQNIWEGSPDIIPATPRSYTNTLTVYPVKIESGKTERNLNE